ncbi:Gfo/Idh/MocA family oxidoreductase [Prosthecobacter sp.]|uniref:Gfo/Idh/MocA family protein n=1 Tax=Prosthecobacter sp. TaxID=1965333 RepID=UPI002ABC6528|nr:Gfo/Idh/MocA family oxidoreductase [Prosthecobacter sp.]MDZ4401098.1 Gfo/Idh/MocA family oxidoreductase [Prosthecobacter sp.]
MKIGIAGFGGAGMAQFRHFQSLGCEVGAVFDPKQPGLERAQRVAPSILLTDDFETFLSSDVDAVSICTPDRTHADYYARSIRAGKDTITEKPLTDSLEGCSLILDAVRECPDRIAAVQHQMRFLPVHLAMKAQLDQKRLGTLSYIEGYYIHNLTQRASLYDPWRFEDNATPLVYSGCHFVDLLRWLLNDEVVEVSAMANNLAFPDYPESDMNVLLMRFRSGVVGKVVTAFGFGRPQDHSVKVYGNERCIEDNLVFARDGSFEIIARPAFPKPRPGLLNLIRYVRQWSRPWLTVKIMEMLLCSKTLPSEYSVAHYPLRMYEHEFAVRESLRDFVQCVQERRKPVCSVVDAARTVATCLAGVEAYRTGQPVKMSSFWLPQFDQL